MLDGTEPPADKLVSAMYLPFDADPMVVANSEMRMPPYSGYHASVAHGYRGFQQGGVQVLKK
jgi:hypothetical protein